MVKINDKFWIIKIIIEIIYAVNYRNHLSFCVSYVPKKFIRFHKRLEGKYENIINLSSLKTVWTANYVVLSYKCKRYNNFYYIFLNRFSNQNHFISSNNSLFRSEFIWKRYFNYFYKKHQIFKYNKIQV